ncbi:hypothetical protein RRG08_011878 [Elysia crispata]|uniref:Uncharacterized protein n=1 Tax=Elysia crispata TaxID=231223 RepID=A0AAE0ZMC6_9GAST|nr:hypothetical protein RRG08_011878 [Elysia crispata]
MIAHPRNLNIRQLNMRRYNKHTTGQIKDAVEEDLECVAEILLFSFISICVATSRESCSKLQANPDSLFDGDLLTLAALHGLEQLVTKKRAKTRGEIRATNKTKDGLKSGQQTFPLQGVTTGIKGRQ